MKITIRDADRGGEVMLNFNNPFQETLQDVVVKPQSHALKLLYVDGTIDEYYLVSDTAKMIEDIDLDLKELHLEYLVKRSMK